MVFVLFYAVVTSVTGMACDEEQSSDCRSLSEEDIWTVVGHLVQFGGKCHFSKLSLRPHAVHTRAPSVPWRTTRIFNCTRAQRWSGLRCASGHAQTYYPADSNQAALPIGAM